MKVPVLTVALCVSLGATCAQRARADDVSVPQSAASLPSDAQLEARGVRIGTVSIRLDPIFNTADPHENKALFRLANRLHVDTRDSSIRSLLLFAPGEPYSRRALEETERSLRQVGFIREPSVRAVRFHDGRVDIEVVAQDVWTLSPGMSFGRAGGENSTGIELEDLNLLGFGKELALKYDRGVDRSSHTLRWRDPSVWGTRWRSELALIESDDGQGYAFAVEHPFFSLATRRSGGVSILEDEGIDRRYALGKVVDAYARDRRIFDARYGWSDGLEGGRTRRVTVGLRYESSEFSEAPGEPVPLQLPEDRRLGYPYLRFETIEDDYETAHNHDQIARTEDLLFGVRATVQLGWAAPAFGADRSAAVFAADVNRGIRLAPPKSLFLSGRLSGRLEGRSVADALLQTDARYYWRTSPRTTFVASLRSEVGSNLDTDHQLVLGGEEGLRGYPLRYQSGTGLALLSLEERFYSDWSLWHIAQIGAAVFVDAGRTWGDAGRGITATRRGVLTDVGFGLRLGSLRSSLANVLHLDIALPLDADSSISGAQFLIQTKSSF